MKRCISKKRRSRKHRNTGATPPTRTLEPSHQEDNTLNPPQGPSCHCCFLHQFPARAEYAPTLDDHPETDKAYSNDRFCHHLITRYPRSPGISIGSRQYLPHHDYPLRNHDVGLVGPFCSCPFLQDEIYPRYHPAWHHYQQEPFFDEDEDAFGVPTMATFFAGYRDADSKRYAEVAKFIREWDITWNKISRKGY